jgi:SAM-dependent methyltransferase
VTGHDGRRTYYDHEGPYRRVLQRGGTGWDDVCPNPAGDSYRDLLEFLAWPGLADLPGRRALELGCGGGQAALILARHGFEVTGVDFAPSAIALATANAAREGLQATFQVGDGLTLAGFPDAVFDLVIDNHMLHCLVEPGDRQRCLSAARRVLAPGGLMFSTTMSCEGTFDPTALGIDPATRISPARTRFWVSEAELRGEFEHAGFAILRLARHPDDGPSGDDLITYARAGP